VPRRAYPWAKSEFSHSPAAPPPSSARASRRSAPGRIADSFRSGSRRRDRAPGSRTDTDRPSRHRDADTEQHGRGGHALQARLADRDEEKRDAVHQCADQERDDGGQHQIDGVGRQPARSCLDAPSRVPRTPCALSSQKRANSSHAASFLASIAKKASLSMSSLPACLQLCPPPEGETSSGLASETIRRHLPRQAPFSLGLRKKETLCWRVEVGSLFRQWADVDYTIPAATWPRRRSRPSNVSAQAAATSTPLIAKCLRKKS
jgi:hypothetical protein